MPNVIDLQSQLKWFPAWSDVEPGCKCSWCTAPIAVDHLPALRILSVDGKLEARLHNKCCFDHALPALKRAVQISLIAEFGPAEDLTIKKKARSR